MEIIETESTLIFENATEGIIDVINSLPWVVFYYECELSNTFFKRQIYPLKNVIDIENLKTIIDGIKEEQGDINVSMNVYFRK